MIEYLIVCPLMFLAGLVDSIAGGGGLISLPAYFIAGVPSHMALGTNKLASSMGTTISTARFIRNGYIKKEMAATAVFASVAALVGSAIGARLSLLVPEKMIQNLMLVILPIVAFYVLRKRDMGDDERTDTYTIRQMFPIVLISAFLVGGYDGFYGPGTGTFLILTGAARMNMRSAAGITKVINLSSNIAALITFIISGNVRYSLGLTAGLFCIAGHYTGSGMVVHNGKKIVRPVILIVLAILFIKIISGR